MRRRYRDEQDDREEFSAATYGTPAVSSWLAAGAVAFAFFVLGGFIKTYIQLEALRKESRREIDALQDSLARLEDHLAATTESPRSGQTPQYYLEPLPPAPRGRQDYAPAAPAPAPQPRAAEPPPAAAGVLRPTPAGTVARPAAAPVPRLEEYLAEEAYLADAEEEAPRVRFGRSSNDRGRQLIAGAATPAQVVSVSGSSGRLMIEGGRDAGINEGLRLELCRDGRWVGDLRVVDVFDNQSSCEVLHATVTPLPGDTVRRTQQ